MLRYLPAAAGFCAAVVLLGISGTGANTGAVLPIAVIAPVAMGVAWWASRRGRSGDQGWERVGEFAFVAAADVPAGSSVAVARALGRVESRELASSASFGVGVGFAALGVVLFGFAFAPDYTGEQALMVQLLAIVAHPLVGLVVLAAFRARTRGRREGVEELFMTCPTSDGTRTTAHLLTGWVAATAALVAAGALLAAIRANVDLVYGPFGGREVAAIAAVAVLGIGGVALGVALARWVPWTLVPVVAVIAVGFVSIRLATAGDRPTEPIRQLSTWLGDPEFDLRFTAPHWGAHLLWLAAITAIVAVVALLHDTRSRTVSGVGAAAVFVAVASAWAATRPIDADDARRIAALIADAPTRNCAVAGSVDVCTLPGDEELRDRYVESITPVVGAVHWPFDPVAFRYASEIEPSDLDPEVQALLAPRGDEPRLIPLDIVANVDAYDAARVWVGLAATGIAEDHRPGSPVTVAGEARGVLALWLATRGADAETTRELTSYDADPDSSGSLRPWPDPCNAGRAPVIWAVSDVAAARALTELPEAAVQEVIGADWDRFVDPATTTDELLVAVGLEGLGEPSGSTRVEEC